MSPCVRVENIIKALKYSIQGIHFGAFTLLTSLDIKEDQKEVIKIELLNYNALNHFLVKKFGNM